MMKKFKTIYLAIGLILLGSLACQSQNSLVSNAIKAYSEGDFEQVFELTGDALVHIDALSGDYIPAAYYYRGKSRIQILRIALEEGDNERLAGMQNALIESYYDYNEALKTANDKLSIDIRRDLADLYNPLLQTGLSALNTAKNDDQPGNVRESALQASLGYLQAAANISQTYLVYDLLGQAMMMTGDSAAALINFNLGIPAYRERPPATPDFLMAYVYFRKAIIERYFLKDNNKALASLMEGQNMLKREYSKSGGALSREDRQAYESGMIDLIGFELDIYLGDPALIDDALVRFREVMSLYPEDYDIHVSYANLLEKVDMNLAIDAYETAISIDDSRELAYFNLGALYNNLGSDVYLKGLNEDTDAMADSLYNEANKYFRKAYINMEQAYNRNPKFLPSIRALVQLARTLGIEEKAEFYKRKELELRGF